MKIFNPLTRRSIKNTEKNRKKMMKFLSEGKVFFNPFTKKFVKRDSGTVLKLLQGKKERWFYNKYSDKLEKRNEKNINQFNRVVKKELFYNPLTRKYITRNQQNEIILGKDKRVFYNQFLDAPQIRSEWYQKLYKDKITEMKNKKAKIDYAIEKTNSYERLNRTTNIIEYDLFKQVEGRRSGIELNNLSIKKIVKSVEELKQKHAVANGHLKIKMMFADDSGNYFQNRLVQSNTEAILEGLLKKMTTTNYVILIQKLVVFQVKFKDQGGCDSKQHTNTVRRPGEKYTLTSMKSKDNNCLIAVFIKFLKDEKILTGRVMPKTIKKKLFPNKLKDSMISIDEIKIVAEYFKVGFKCYNQMMELISSYDETNALVVDMMLVINHYSAIESCEYIEKYCKFCNVNYLKTHNCNTNKVSFINHKFGKKDIVTTKIKQYKELNNLSNVLVYDFETLNAQQGDDRKATPYCVGYKYINRDNDGTYNYLWGENCLVEFVDYLLSIKEETIITAYNGSNFDLYFILNELNRRGVEIKDIVKNGNSILKLDFGHIAVFDLCKFLLTSLDNACKGFKIANSKTSFDHKLIRSFADTEKYKEVILEYLKFDILSLEELMLKVSDEFYIKYQVYLTDYFTVSHLSYSLWKNTFSNLNNNIYLTKNEEDYAFVRKSIIGGRTYPLQKYYLSSAWEEFEQHKNDKEALKELYRKTYESNDFIFNADVNSLYPAAMIQFEYPVGKHRYSEDPEGDFKKGLLGIYNIEFTSKKDLIISPFSSKTVGGRLSWNVKDGEGIYNSIDIQNAIDMGYKVKFLRRAIVWDKKENIFQEYIDDIYKMKRDAKETGNKVRYSLSKLLMNSLYGKTLQRACVDSTKIISDFDGLCKFLAEYNITDYDILKGDSVILTGEALEIKQKITKPSHIGSFVLGYSRKIMLNYMRELSPNLTEHPFTYTDTDSMHIKGRGYKDLLSKGLINEEVGGMSNDIDGNNPIIIREINFAPKLYCYWWIDADGNHGFTNKAKGLPKKLLSQELYLNEEKKQLQYFGFKKIGSKIYKPDQRNGFDHFTIKPIQYKRTFLNSTWEGMTLKNNLYYPIGYAF